MHTVVETSSLPSPATTEIAGRRVCHLLQRGTGDAVLLVHGFGGNLGNWSLNQSALADSGRTVAALDLPGHGESSKTLASGSLEELAANVRAYMDAMGIASAHLVGHSMGAAVCLLLADEAPARVASLTLIAPAGLGQAINRDFIAGLVTAVEREQVLPLLHQLYRRPDLVTPRLVDDMLRYKQLAGVCQALTLIAGNRFRGTPGGGQLRDVVGRVPTLVVWGAEDSIVPPPDPAAFAGERVRFHVLPGCGHMVQLEAADEVNRLLLDFLDQ